MKSEIVDVNETRRDLTIEVPSEVVNEAIGHAAAKLGRSVKIPGFRPGKVPATVIRQRFKPQIMQDVAEHLVSKAVGDALVEKGVEPIGTPDIQDLVLEEGKPLTFKATFDVVPELRSRRSLDHRSDRAVARDRRRGRQPVARAPARTQRALRSRRRAASSKPATPSSSRLERKGTDKEGKAGDAEKHEQVSIELGAPSNPPGFDAEVIGMVARARRRASRSPIPRITRSPSWPAARSITRST